MIDNNELLEDTNLVDVSHYLKRTGDCYQYVRCAVWIKEGVSLEAGIKMIEELDLKKVYHKDILFSGIQKGKQ